MRASCAERTEATLAMEIGRAVMTDAADSLATDATDAVETIDSADTEAR